MVMHLPLFFLSDGKLISGTEDLPSPWAFIRSSVYSCIFQLVHQLFQLHNEYLKAKSLKEENKLEDILRQFPIPRKIQNVLLTFFG